MLEETLTTEARKLNSHNKIELRLTKRKPLKRNSTSMFREGGALRLMLKGHYMWIYRLKKNTGYGKEKEKEKWEMMYSKVTRKLLRKTKVNYNICSPCMPRRCMGYTHGRGERHG